MRLFQRKTQGDEIIAAYSALDEVEQRFHDDVCDAELKRIVTIMRDTLSKHSEDFSAMFRSSSRSPREWVYSNIVNATGDLLETGQFHVYRGMLSPVGRGLLSIFDASVDELLEMGAKDVNSEVVAEQKSVLRSNIRQIG